MATLPENPNMETQCLKEVKQGSQRHIENIINLLTKNTYHHRMHDVFRDFVAMTACALSNVADKVNFKDREAEYMRIVNKYKKEEVLRFSKAFAELCFIYELGGFNDVLGELYMLLELGNEAGGQFFTPYHLCQMMGRMVGPTKEEINNKIYKNGFIRANDPAVGAGATLIALAESMYLNGINYQQCLHVTATDIDITAVHMAYIQFSLYHIPSVITWGNTLTLETWGYWYTPAHILGNWEFRLKTANMIDKFRSIINKLDITESPKVEPTELPIENQVIMTPDPIPEPIKIGEQISLF